jgi:hypothetical protein
VEEQLPVVGRIGAVGREVDDLVRVQLLRPRLDDPLRRLVRACEAEAAVLQLDVPRHQAPDALERVVDRAREVANERVVEVLEVEPSPLEEPKRQEPEERVEVAHEVADEKRPHLVVRVRPRHVVRDSQLEEALERVALRLA